VSRWARSAREALAWCSRAQAPVPAEVIADWGRGEDVGAYGLHVRGRLVAYGELWVDHDEREVEIARVIVSPAHRGRGIGRQLIRRLADQARRSYPSVVVRVRPDNDAALRCYAAAGFERVPPGDEELWNRGQPVHYAWMAHRSAD
jgi:[ribosomal protein S18]-alanine N-acetyltransferase